MRGRMCSQKGGGIAVVVAAAAFVADTFVKVLWLRPPSGLWDRAHLPRVLG